MHLQLSVLTVKMIAASPTDLAIPKKSRAVCFPYTYTTDTLEWVWYDGKGARLLQDELKLPKGDRLIRELCLLAKMAFIAAALYAVAKIDC